MTEPPHQPSPAPAADALAILATWFVGLRGRVQAALLVVVITMIAGAVIVYSRQPTREGVPSEQGCTIIESPNASC